MVTTMSDNEAGGAGNNRKFEQPVWNQNDSYMRYSSRVRPASDERRASFRSWRWRSL